MIFSVAVGIIFLTK